jgi:hypothetical protein
MPEGVPFQIGKFDVGPYQLLMFAAIAVLFLVVNIACRSRRSQEISADLTGRPEQ